MIATRARGRWPRVWPRLLAAGLLGLTAGAAMATDTVTMAPDAVRHEMRLALAAGDAQMAWHLAQALIGAGVHRYDALIALAEAERRLGRPDAARRAARNAVQLAATPKQKFESALIRANTAETDSAFGGLAAQFWTRRAIHLAPIDAYRAVARGELARVRSDAPLQLQFSLTASPSSNVNNGVRATHIAVPPDLGGGLWALAPQARALSGFVAEAGVAGRYRLHQDQTSATMLRFAAHRREVRLSGDARAQIEAWRQQQIGFGLTPPPVPDYDYAAVEVGLLHARVSGNSRHSLGATVGHAWFGGSELGDYLRLEAGTERQLTPRSLVFGGLTLERHWRKVGAGSDALALQGGLQGTTGNGDRLRLSAQARNTISADANQRHQALGLRLGWEKAQPLAGISIEASIGAEARRYDPTQLAPGGRRDMRLDATLSLRLDRFDYMGFVPVVNLNASRVKSNVALYDGSDGGITLGFRSRF